MVLLVNNRSFFSFSPTPHHHFATLFPSFIFPPQPDLTYCPSQLSSSKITYYYSPHVETIDSSHHTSTFLNQLSIFPTTIIHPTQFNNNIPSLSNSTPSSLLPLLQFHPTIMKMIILMAFRYCFFAIIGNPCLVVLNLLRNLLNFTVNFTIPGRIT